jgi:hypothetical protein
MRLLTLSFFLFFVSAGSFAEDKIVNAKKHESVNYCHNKLETKKWQAMLIKYQGDTDIMKLYALRLGLCRAVDDKKIKLDDAIDVFNVEHLKVAEEWAKEAKKNESVKKIMI